VQYCHSLGIYHRDLKPENILCTNGGQDVYVADFGLATSERVSRDFGCGSTFYMSPECQGGIFDRLNSYSTQTNDVWSLGVILVNLTCGRNPWRQACPSDETFRAFLQNPNFLRSILPISKNLNYILRRIFEVDPRLRLTLKQLRVLVENIDTFNMTEAELRYAHSAAQAAAASVARPRKAPVQQLPPQPIYEESSSGSSSVYQSEYAFDPSSPSSEAGVYQHTPRLESSSPVLQGNNRSRSSSTDSDSLPPTPEAAATDVSIIPIPEMAFNLDQGASTNSKSNYAADDLRILRPMSVVEASSRHANPFVL
jgi:serine/threonine protein kinase